MKRPLRAIVLVCVALLAGCATRPAALEGRVWDAAARRFITQDEFHARAARARYVLLGEKHDNALHQHLQARVLEQLLHGGLRPALAMEAFDGEWQQALDAASPAADAEALADAGRLDRRAWRWPAHRELLEVAARARLRVLAANLSRRDAARIVKDPGGSGLPPAPAALREALERDIVEGHCGQLPGPLVPGMVEAQRARDARMASVLESSGAAQVVLVAGAGHVRKDRGAPVYLSGGPALSVALTEIDPGLSDPADYDPSRSFDYLWFTPSMPREDPCRAFERNG